MEELSKKALRRLEARQKALKAAQPMQEAQQPAESAPAQKKRAWKEQLKAFYEKNLTKMMLIPVVLLLFAFIQIGYQTAATGDFLNKGISLKGGITVTIPEAPLPVEETEAFLRQQFSADITVREIRTQGAASGMVIDADLAEQAQIDAFKKAIEEKFGIREGSYTIEIIGAALGENFFRQTFWAIIFSFLLMAITVFAYFRVPIPSVAVILAAFTDIIVTLAIVNVLGVKVSTAGIGAFLMLIGYSIDTDILLTTRVLRRKEGTAIDGIFSGMRTGTLMLLTTMVAITIGLIFAESDVLRQIFTILLIGLIVDFPATWIQNAGIIKWYTERKHHG